MESIELHDDAFLSNFTNRERTIITTIFAEAIRKREFSRPSSNPLVSATVRATVDNISQTFREFDHGDPRLNETGKTSRLLQQQLKGYKEEDPAEKQEKAIPFSVLRFAYENALTDLDRAIAQICIGAMFFCMRSCKYLKVSNPEDRKTKLLCLRNFRFFLDKKLLDHREERIENATLVCITFEDQKNREKNDSISLHRSNDKTLCPVRAWASIVRRIWNYEGATRDSPVNSFILNKKQHRISAANVTKALRTAVRQMKSFDLGFEAEEVGTHSIRSGGAMALCLAKTDVYMVMMIGHWKSDSFMKYIRKQIRQFSAGLTEKMLEAEHFNHVPKDMSLLKSNSRITKDGKGS